MYRDHERCRRAVASRDARFDGWFVVAVRTTRIYCRPSCPARTPRPENMDFYPTAAAAQRSGFRACKRCRPDATPGSPEWSTRGDVVARAMRLVADGVVDREGVGGLAKRLGYSVRHLERLLVAEVGTGPLALARAQRAQTARLLIETTDLTLSTVAFAAGFSSIRQFNDTVRAVFDASPTTLRSRAARSGRDRRVARRAPPLPPAAGSPAAGSPVAGLTPLTLRLAVRAPFAGPALWDRLGSGAVPGCEELVAGTYRRTLRLPGGAGIVALALPAAPLPAPARSTDHVVCRLLLEDVSDLAVAIARCRRLLDLDADPQAVGEVLGADPALAPLVESCPGRRVLGGVDEHESAVRIVLGQQVSRAAAVTHAARLVAHAGTPVHDPEGTLTHLFPTAATLAGTLADEVPAGGVPGVPRTRRRALVALVEALASGALELGPGADRERARQQLLGLPGVGAWTAEVIALRALGDPDAFPAGDLGLRRAAEALGLPSGEVALTRRARCWRPWRSSAAAHLWAHATPSLTQSHPDAARTTPRSTPDRAQDGARAHSPASGGPP